MNIKINESKNNNKSDLTESDLFNYIDTTFSDNPKNWSEATMEIVDMANWIYETVKDTVSQKLAEPLKDTKKSGTPKEWNIKHKKRIKDGFNLLNDYNKKQFFEQFGDWIRNIKNLNESEAEKQIKTDYDNLLENVMKLKSKQFIFDSQLFMGTINSGLNIMFGLLYHAKQTNNVEDFINSVKTFMESTTKTSISENDVERLTKHYNKYYLI